MNSDEVLQFDKNTGRTSRTAVAVAVDRPNPNALLLSYETELSVDFAWQILESESGNFDPANEFPIGLARRLEPIAPAPGLSIPFHRETVVFPLDGAARHMRVPTRWN